mgnify:CR=1 FL=1
MDTFCLLLASVPPGLPPAASRSRRPSPWIFALLFLFALAALWAWRGHVPDGRQTARAPSAGIASPLAGLAQAPAEPAPAPACAAPAAIAPANDEDRFLVAGGARRLTGRSVRKGDTYVAEAARQLDAHCRPDRLQLYVFRGGVFVGATLVWPASPQHGRRIVDFDLADEQQLNYHLADCDQRGSCDQVAARSALLVHGPAGWQLQRDDAGPNAPRLVSQVPPSYPPEALRLRHQGIVVLRIAIDPHGLPGEVWVLRSSGFPELDQAAMAAARQWRFRPAQRGGKAVTSNANVPINFSLSTP